jgi:hypothetical protein
MYPRCSNAVFGAHGTRAARARINTQEQQEIEVVDLDQEHPEELAREQQQRAPVAIDLVESDDSVHVLRTTPVTARRAKTGWRVQPSKFVMVFPIFSHFILQIRSSIFRNTLRVDTRNTQMGHCGVTCAVQQVAANLLAWCR